MVILMLLMMFMLVVGVTMELPSRTEGACIMGGATPFTFEYRW
jgi:hypothetical protein